MRNNPPRVETHEWEAAEAPFERVHVDYAGPFMNSYFLVLVDAFSKWPFVRIVKNITAKTTIHKCKEIFSEFGVPQTLIMDNGSNFRSTEFQQFLKINGITPKFIAPYHPSTNGQAERFIQTMKNSLRKMLTDPRNNNLNLESALHEFLIQYRITPHCVTRVTPFEKMFNRRIHTCYTACVPNKESAHKCKREQEDSRVYGEGERTMSKLCLGTVRRYQILRSGEFWDDFEEPQVKVELEGPGTQGEAVGPQNDREPEAGLQPNPEEVPRAEEMEEPDPAPARQEGRPIRNRRPPTRYPDPRGDRE
ncbi:PREDICTED: uncharacterized protein K02A2.6-like [Vollenhovia emeryi]|uniref:uncharacterized protein K02A2.6-like n=1 Tax=Vollenhovia emeryi TaxID=411798 RepID=UPI0005F3C08F|nr:PREDICTED: uncharacterized protein K02A2.6-like [Vollenhovia emeryi]